MSSPNPHDFSFVRAEPVEARPPIMPSDKFRANGNEMRLAI